MSPRGIENLAKWQLAKWLKRPIDVVVLGGDGGYHEWTVTPSSTKKEYDLWKDYIPA